MREITRDEFAAAVGALRPDLVAPFLEDADIFFECRGALLSVQRMASMEMVWVCGVLGSGLDWARELRSWGLGNGFKWIGFKAKTDLPWGRAIARYTKARLMAVTESGNEYCAPLRAR